MVQTKAIKVKTEWDLTPLFSSIKDSALEKERKEVTKAVTKFAEKWRADQSYLSNVDSLLQALQDYESLMDTYGISGRQGYYVFLLQSLNQTDPEIKAANNTVDEWAIKNANMLNFFDLSLGKIEPKTKEIFLKEEKLSKYKHFLERIFSTAKYHLSEKEENLVNTLSPFGPESWIKFNSEQLSKKTGTIIIDGKAQEKTLPELAELRRNFKKDIRDQAGPLFTKLLDENKSIAEAEINTMLGELSTIRKLRGATRFDEFRLVGDDMDSEVVDTLADVVYKNRSIPQRFHNLKAKLLGQKKLELYETVIEFPVLEKEFTFKEAVDIVCEVFNNLDPQFVGIFRDFVEKGQFDIYPQKGKRQGGFCASEGRNDPVYILLNFTGVMNDILTIAHETGHGIHSELMRIQSPLYFGLSLATAEVASTFMEDFVTQELLKQVNEEQRLYLMMNKLTDETSTIHTQIAGYQSELDLHKAYEEKKFLTYDQICDLFEKRRREYTSDIVSQQYDRNRWIYISHIRRPFYMYSYASGLLISKALQNRVKADKSFISKVKEFLSIGVSESPLNIFLKLGIDIRKREFWEDGIKELDELVTSAENLARKLGKI